MNNHIDYLTKIRQCLHRWEAATLVRAKATHDAAHLGGCYSADECLSIIKSAEHLAESIERDYYTDDGDTLCSEALHPWRRWLRAAGY